MDTIGDIPDMDDPTIEGYAGDLPWVRRTALLLNLMGVLGLLSAVLSVLGAAMTSAPSTGDPVMDAQMAEALMPTRIGQAVGGICCSLPYAVIHFVTASNLSAARKWAWFVALVLAVTWIPSCLCVPVSAIAIFGLVQEDVRKRFLG